MNPLTGDIPADSVLNAHQVYLATGLTPAQQAEERAAGRLKGSLINGAPRYRGAAVLDWLKAREDQKPEADDSAATNRRSRSPYNPAGPAAAAAGALTAPSHPHQEDTMPPSHSTGPATRRWNARVEESKSEGLTQAEAIKAVIAADPELHRQYLAEANEAAGRAKTTHRIA